MTTPTDQLDAAKAFRDRGWRPIPLDHPALPECIGPEPCDGKRGKHPTRGSWATKAAIAQGDNTLALWWGDTIGPRNIGIACKPSGLLVVDEDVDGALERFAAWAGAELPRTYRVRTARGWHYYFLQPPGADLGNKAGLLESWGMDVRGGGTKEGGYVVAAGSVHESGHIYTAEDEFIGPAPLPLFVHAAILTKPARASDSSGELGGTVAVEWAGDDGPREGTTTELLAQFTRRCAAIVSRGNAFRVEQLFPAARDGWRLVNLGILGEAVMRERLDERIWAVWGAPPNEQDEKIIADALTAAKADPWTVNDSLLVASVQLGGPAPAQNVDPVTGASAGPVELVSAQELLIQEEERRLEIRDIARRRHAARNLPAATVIDLDAFSVAQPVQYLIDRLLWRVGTARIFGAPGSTKSFLALDIALSLASGAPWKVGGETAARDPVTVHYVMAEGVAVNVMRTNAWFAHHGEVFREAAQGRFRAIPQGVLLTPEGIARYLELVTADRPALIVLDTKARMMAGNENGPEENFALVRAVDLLKEASGGCVVLVDHTGLYDDTRARGHGSVRAAMDTEIRVTYDEGRATAMVDRDKAAEAGAYWNYRLSTERLSTVRLTSVGHYVDHSAPVPVPTTDSDQPSWLQDQEWHDLEAEPLPEALLAKMRTVEDGSCPFRDPGREDSCPGDGHKPSTVTTAHDVIRVLRAKAGARGLTQPEIGGLLRESGRFKKTAFYAAMSMLDAHGVLARGETSSRFTVA